MGSGICKNVVVGLEGLILARDDFGGAEVHVLNDAIVVEEDVYGGISNGRLAKQRLDRHTLGLDVSVADAALVKVS